MIVTRLEEFVKNRFKVYVEDEFAFVLYKGELSRYKLRENSEITDEEYTRILEEIVIKRAKKRAMYLLEKMSRTEKQLEEKLKMSYYPQVAIDAALSYVKQFGYIGDESYARNYISSKMRNKSRKEIYFALQSKGIHKDIIDKMLCEAYEDADEQCAIQKLILKKRYNSHEATDKEREKMYSYLMRKGFSYEDIRQIL